jgi:NAD(P)-dependent dehydrogenase (short-subunit alcohol dehydrogenase family)
MDVHPIADSRAVARLSSRYPQRRILITGATSGSGEALALLFGRHGWRVAVTGRNREKVAASADKVRAAGGEVLEIGLEVTRYEDFERAAQEVTQAWGGLDILVNNAGVLGGSSLEDGSIESWHRVIDINTFGVIRGCKAFAPVLRASGGGHILNVASLAGIASAPEMGSYNVSKAAVISLSETLKVELAPHKIDVTVACPGVFQSDIGAEGKCVASAGDDRMIESLKQNQAGTSQTAEDVIGHIVGDMAGRRLYSLPGLEVRAQWLFKRAFPESSRRLIAFLFTRRLWVFAGIGDSAAATTATTTTASIPVTTSATTVRTP